ncbi:MAG TPA: hypothetical protein VMV21_07605 [Vicinamibacteria bacterium]|nr:hypothetical protein [Vicinamibacteria bacterium]
MGLNVILGSSIACALVLAAQVTVNPPTPLVPGTTQRQGDADYGPPRVAELEAINMAPESYQREHVITLGRVDVLKPGRFWTLHDGSATVLLVAGLGVTAADLDAFASSRVEIRGIVRRVRKKEYLHGVDMDLVEDPTLPVLPEQSYELPKISITVLAASDRDDHSAGRTAPTGALTREILTNPADFVGKTVRIRGQFRGRNLFGDLPTRSRRDDEDWVLKDGELALWVTGKAPRGKGFALDPGYKGDTVRWLEVAGKAEVTDGIVYLRASKITLAAKPKEVETAGQ